MSNPLENAFKKLSEALKSNDPKLNKLFNDFGVSKDDVLNQMDSMDHEELAKSFNSSEMANIIDKLSPAELQKLKNINIENKDQVEELYKNFMKNKEGK